MFEVTFGLEILAFLTGLICFTQISPIIYRLTVLLLLITVINEALSHYKVYAEWKLSKLIFYNIFFLLQIIIIGIIYFSVSGRKIKIVVSLFLVLTIISAVVLFSENKGSSLNPNYISFICITAVFFGVSYLFNIFMEEKILKLSNNPLFWFSIGLVVAQSLLLFYINAKRVDSFQKDPNTLIVFRTFNMIGNIVYYLCICYSFICTLIFRKRVGM